MIKVKFVYNEDNNKCQFIGENGSEAFCTNDIIPKDLLESFFDNEITRLISFSSMYEWIVFQWNVYGQNDCLKSPEMIYSINGLKHFLKKVANKKVCSNKFNITDMTSNFNRLCLRHH